MELTEDILRVIYDKVEHISNTTCYLTLFDTEESGILAYKHGFVDLSNGMNFRNKYSVLMYRGLKVEYGQHLNNIICLTDHNRKRFDSIYTDSVKDIEILYDMEEHKIIASFNTPVSKILAGNKIIMAPTISWCKPCDVIIYNVENRELRSIKGVLTEGAREFNGRFGTETIIYTPNCEVINIIDTNGNELTMLEYIKVRYNTDRVVETTEKNKTVYRVDTGDKGVEELDSLGRRIIRRCIR